MSLAIQTEICILLEVKLLKDNLHCQFGLCPDILSFCALSLICFEPKIRLTSRVMFNFIYFCQQ